MKANAAPSSAISATLGMMNQNGDGSLSWWTTAGAAFGG